MVNDWLAHLQPQFCARVDSPFPQTAAKRVEIFWMFSHQQRFGLAVSLLLLKVIAHRGTTIVPHERRRAEAKPIAALLQSPANVHVIAGFVKNWIEPAYLVERRSEEGHIAAGDVLGQTVGQHHVSRTARRYHHSRGNR